MTKFTENQLNAIEKEGNLIVSASAGSGKTTVMIERAAKLILSGVDIRRIVIMTFTNASANDMKEKLVKKISEKIAERQGDTEFLKKQIKLIHFANISTIDSFCSKIYNTYFEDIGKMPNSNILDSAKQKKLLLNASEDMLKSFLEKEDKKAIAILEYFTKNRSLDKLKNLLIYIYNFISAQSNPKEFLKGLKEDKIEILKNYLLTTVRKKLRAYEVNGQIIKNRLLTYGLDTEIENINILLANLSLFENVSDIYQFSEKLNYINGLSYRKNTAKKTLEEKEAIEKFVSFKSSLLSYLEDIKEKFSDIDIKLKKDEKSREINSKFVEMVELFLDNYSKAKQEENYLDFADIEHYALEILQNPERRESIKSNYDYIFIDEYQDTNYLQEEILKNISGEDNLFTVGDSKQAIYKFRFAEPKIFLDRYYNYKNKIGGQSEVLNHNFRSSKQIIDFVNGIFNEIMTEDFGKLDYKEAAQLISGFEYPDYNEGKNIETAFFVKEQERETTSFEEIYSVKNFKRTEIDEESLYIADKIEDLVGKKYIYDIKTDSRKLITYGDIVILTRTKKADDILAELNRRNIPVFSGGYGKSKNFSLALIIDFLSIIDNIKNDVPLLNVLISFLGGFEENQLLEIRNNNEDKNAYFYQCFLEYAKDGIIRAKIDAFLLSIQKYKKQSAYLSVHQLLTNIFIDFEIENQLLSQEGKRDELYDLKSFINGVQEEKRSLSMFLNDINIEERETVNVVDGDDAVSIMTAHKSKGLEFPIVFLAQTGGRFNAEYDKNFIMIDKDFGLAFNFFDEELKIGEHTFSNQIFKMKNTSEEKEALLRLLYVALTRARYMLFISGYKNKKIIDFPDEANSFAEWLIYAAEKNEELKIYNSYSQFKAVNDNISKRKFRYKIPLIDRKPYVFEENTRFSGKFYASGVKDNLILGSDAESEEKYFINHTRKYSDAPQKVPISADLGTQYHEIMQKIDFNMTKMSEIERFLEDFFKDKVNLGINKEFIFEILNNKFIAEIKGKKLLKEQEFIIYVKANEIFDTKVEDKILIQGAVDLLVLGDNPIMVDYKVTDKDDDYLIKTYKNQLNLYAYAAEKILKLKNLRKVLFVINRNKIIEL